MVKPSASTFFSVKAALGVWEVEWFIWDQPM
jgi:hypothetical protein